MAKKSKPAGTLQQQLLSKQIGQYQQELKFYEKYKPLYQEWLKLPQTTVIRENDPRRADVSNTLEANYCTLYLRCLHVCDSMPKDEYIWLNYTQPGEYWVLNKKERMQGEHIDVCPHCGAKLSECKGDVQFIKADSGYWDTFLNYYVPKFEHTEPPHRSISDCQSLLYETEQKIIFNADEWKSFLAFSSKIYKYDFVSALLAYAQRPDALALASTLIWERINRTVKEGAKSISVLKNSKDGVHLMQLFDVKDTAGDISTLPQIWHMAKEDRKTVLLDLQDKYGLRLEPPFENSLNTVIEKIAINSYNLYCKTVLANKEETPLERFSDDTVQDMFYDLLTDSITYVVYSRIDPKNPILSSLLFDGLQFFNTNLLIEAIGNSTNQVSAILLRQIETTINQIDLEQLKIQRRNEDGNRLHERQRRPALPGFGDNGGAVQITFDEIRNQVQAVSGGKSSRDVHPPYSGDGLNENLPSGGGRSEGVRSTDGGAAPQEQPEAQGGRGRLHEERAVQQLALENSGGNDAGEHRVPREVEEPQKAASGQEAAFSAVKNDYHFSSADIVQGGQKAHYTANVAAIRLLKDIEAAGRLATLEEQKVLAGYAGWGGIPQAFDSRNTKWTEEYSELKELLTPDEYEAARASTLTAFYTPPESISAIHTALRQFGFAGGNVLEPSCGTGRFFGLMPNDIKANSRLFGVELDSVTGRIARQLNQTADIQIKGYENTSFSDNFFDVAIGNVPFGEFKVNDPRYNHGNYLIHDYFFVKTLDMVRPGGVIAFVTSKGTMDKANPEIRRYIAQRAELIGAVRLPNTTMKEEANTSVTSDILFLQKRQRIVDVEPEWVHLTYVGDKIPVNAYFASHPDMMLGTMTFSKNMYGNEKDTALLPDPQRDWKEEIIPAVLKMDTEYRAAVQTVLDEPGQEDTIPADPRVKNYSYTVDNGKIYYRENSAMYLKNLTGIPEKRVRSLIELRTVLRECIHTQRDDCPETDIVQVREKLNQVYDAFVRKFGYVYGWGNQLVFQEDADYPLLCSLEVTDDNGLTHKADIFTKRTIRPPTVVTHVDTALDALPHSLNRKGCVDISYISQLTGKSEYEVLRDLSVAIYKNPITQEWETADEYLSGNVREKLRTAQNIARTDKQYAVNVEALKQVQPEDLKAGDVSIRLGSPLLEPEEIRQYIKDIFKPTDMTRISVEYIPNQALWKVTAPSLFQLYRDVNAKQTYGTKRINAYELLELTLNQKTPTIRDRQPDNTYKFNPKDTMAARDKQRKITHKFDDWVFSNPQRREKLLRKYNERYNNLRLRHYDGSYLTFPGMTPEINLKQHQRDAVARILASGNTLLAHCVGAGKTYEMIAAAMESKRLGLCHKSMFVVPNHLLDQWASDILRLYPGANVLIANKKEFSPQNRQRFVSRIATGDFDAVVITQSSFSKIPVSGERVRHTIKKQIRDIMDSMAEAESTNGHDWTVKQMERTKKALEQQLEKLSQQSKKDNVITFEELGVDQLFVDEAHGYKNLFVPTKMTNVAGISAVNSQKASDMLMKCRYINELHHGQRGIVFATGTPVSNSMAELFTMQTYLQMNYLDETGMSHFDSWASMFGRTKSSLELTPDGTRYQYKTRFAEFVNIPELMKGFALTADIQTADMLKLPVPAIKGGKPITVVAKPSPELEQYVKELVSRLLVVHNGGIDAREDNALKITFDGRCAALDMRLVDPSFADFAGSKVNLAVENIYNIWLNSADNLGTQLVFCDLSTPKPGQFNVYDDMAEKLSNMGIPREDIAFIHDAKTDEQKKELFAKVRSGKIRVLFGSTAKMGVGTNVQKRVVALHHIDAPWRPSDLEQRDGRAIRQYNDNDVVAIYRYVTEGSFDAYLWQILEQKQRFISQVMRREFSGRHAADIDDVALDYATVKALASKDPRIKEREELRVRVSELSVLKAEFNSEKYQMEDDLLKKLPEQIRRDELAVGNLQHDIGIRDKNTAKNFQMEVEGMKYTDRGKAGEHIQAITERFRSSTTTLPIGQYRGFAMQLQYDAFSNAYSILLCGKVQHTVEIGKSASGCVTRLDNKLQSFEEAIEKCTLDKRSLHKEMQQTKAELAKPWEHEQEFQEKSDRLGQLDIELNAETGDMKEQVIDDQAPIEVAPPVMDEEEQEQGMNVGM